ncbi:selenium cofactor biosynthesis protein YqeC [Natrinema salsiterrestre]|uniref:Selenium cofactor biosynthesis protein YqeC n=1 Tax=Natrinema salsiterrestre TaxID=2950540 RepID=A0A9Q4L1U3_9EURY|nr:selenium cofactor biosynthesis protein YqeC [Natrinema salsiterrestre]MDF9748525.1 selenium cofactor biosynthesis protein YqeC [Natrinema salsiterrestre]
MELVEALDAGDGLVCVVGAGGKKTTLYALADRIERSIVTATVRIPIFDDHVDSVTVTDDPRAAVRTASSWPFGVVRERERADRYRGFDPDIVTSFVDEISDRVDVVLVKADGARTRLLKAPNRSEPRIPEVTDTVVPIASAAVVGKRLTSEHVHRPKLVSELTGLDTGDRIRPVDVATVLADDDGGHKRVPDGSTVIPVVNMVDNDRRERIGREIATAILERTDVPRVVLTRMIATRPVVTVCQ